MNLAQLIDPERVERMKSEHGAPGKALGVVKHSTLDDDDLAHKERSRPKMSQAAGALREPDPEARFRRSFGVPGRILRLCARSDASLSSHDIAQALACGNNQVCANLVQLVNAVHLRRTGERRSYRYAITASGRERLAQLKARAGIP